MSLADTMRQFIRLIRKKLAAGSTTTGEKTGEDEFERRYRAFQDLLEQNNRVLEVMADMEEKRSGEFVFDRQYIDSRLSELLTGVEGIIRSLNELSAGTYRGLDGVYATIRDALRAAVSCGHIPQTDLCVPLSGLARDSVLSAGGKMANLGEVRNRLGLSVPDGFCITAWAFKRFLEHNRMTGKMRELLSRVELGSLASIEQVSREMQAAFRAADVPKDIAAAVREALERLRAGSPAPLLTAVRSSAVQEDGTFSFAGQYASFLNVAEDRVLERYREVLASLFTPRAVYYYAGKRFCEDELAMAVGVMRMVPAAAAGVLYTRDPRDPERDSAIINAVPGLGTAVVEGSVHPDSYVLSRADGSILEQATAEHCLMDVCNPGGGVKRVAVPADVATLPSLRPEQVRELWRAGMLIEKHFSTPQDIEWAIGQDGTVVILQSRPLRVGPSDARTAPVPRRIRNRMVLLDRGTIACKGIGFGTAFVLRTEDDLNDVPEGAVLVARNTSTRFVTVMDRVTAIITDVGSVAGHMASLSREYEVPTIVDAETATAAIRHGQDITVDAVNCTVYEGLVEELRPWAKKRTDPFRETPLFRTLERVLRSVTPLHLTDPDAPDFRPEACRTLHDITRFAHEKAMAEMFSLGDAYDGRMKTVDLRAGIPVQAHLRDLGGGLRPGVRSAAPDDILSVPFRAFLAGLRGMKWPEPRPADVTGFLGMIAHTATLSEEELRRTGEKSFALLSRNYMNFSIRLGYHFSQVEAYAGDALNDNYIKFFFSGGGAVRDRRLRRVRLIRQVLEALDFRVAVSDDVVRAELLKYRIPALAARLEVLGRLTAYTKQLDMTLFNDAVTDWYIEEFISEHIAPRHDLRPAPSVSP